MGSQILKKRVHPPVGDRGTRMSENNRKPYMNKCGSKSALGVVSSRVDRARKVAIGTLILERRYSPGRGHGTHADARLTSSDSLSKPRNPCV